MDINYLYSVWQKLNQRNIELGLIRYDYGDTSSHPFIIKTTKHPFLKPLYYIFKIPEYISPTYWRVFLRIKKRLVPSSYYHLGLTYLSASSLGLNISVENLNNTCAEALSISIKGAKYTCWEHPYEHHASSWREDKKNINIPPSCAHHTSRLGIMLITMGKSQKNDSVIQAGIQAANALLTYHNWERNSSNSCTISYYPFTNDSVINTGADTALLLSLIPPKYYSNTIKSALICLTNMICEEQNSDGSWFYCTRHHYAKNRGVKVIDNHHSAMNILALAQILNSPNITKNVDLKKKITLSLGKGVNYYLDKFVSSDGKACYFPNSSRDAGVVGYSEGIRALSAACLALGTTHKETTAPIKKILPLLLKTAITRYMNQKTGDVACYVNYGIAYQISSARWGSLPLMHAITDYIDFIKKEGAS